MTTILFRTWRNPYCILWKTKRSIKGIVPKLDTITFYSKGEDVELTVTHQDLAWSVEPTDTKNQFEFSADGFVTVDIDPKTLQRLKKAGSIDHVVAFYPNKDDADLGVNAFEPDKDYELIENSNIALEIVKASPAANKGDHSTLTAETIAQALGLTSAKHMKLITTVVDFYGGHAVEGPISSLSDFSAKMSIYSRVFIEKAKDKKVAEEIIIAASKSGVG